jgi:hypothetical protein
VQREAVAKQPGFIGTKCVFLALEYKHWTKKITTWSTLKDAQVRHGYVLR